MNKDVLKAFYKDGERALLDLFLDTYAEQCLLHFLSDDMDFCSVHLTRPLPDMWCTLR